ncbi:MAG: hypothetical protein P8I02_02975 [Flavobacteriales bacterium]|nr:hypothetical protein [Flavobacteriales bacterium]
MEWEKLGKIFSINNKNVWLVSHSSVPFARHLKEGVFRIYYSVRNKNNKSQSSYFDYNLESMKIVNELTKAPLMKPGIKGSFDDAGVTLSCYCNDNDMYYYMGWNIPKNVPFDNQIGASYLEGNIMKKYITNPIFGKCDKEPLSFGYPWVLKVKKNYYMWYDTNFSWNPKDPKNYKFPLRSAISKDGIKWEKTYHTNIKLKENERAIARPCVIYEDERFKMWYSIDINGKYSITYAESFDGRNWIQMDDKVGIVKSNNGWDSEEIEYPFVFDFNSDRYMLYNGNNYGKSGIGLAILKK